MPSVTAVGRYDRDKLAPLSGSLSFPIDLYRRPRPFSSPSSSTTDAIGGCHGKGDEDKVVCLSFPIVTSLSFSVELRNGRDLDSVEDEGHMRTSCQNLPSPKPEQFYAKRRH
jgi:hypothetical protein